MLNKQMASESTGLISLCQCCLEANIMGEKNPSMNEIKY